MSELSFSPKAVTKNLFTMLPDRSRHVLTDRFGLSAKNVSRTLDSIGQEYGITRERVRQIENHALATLRESSTYREHTGILDDLKNQIHALGGILSEEALLDKLAQNVVERNHLVFLLTLGQHFNERREDKDFNARWYIDEQTAEQVEEALTSLYKSIGLDTLMPEEEFVQLFSKYLKVAGIKNKPDEEMLGRWLKMSKRVGKNPLGEWGKMESPHVRIKNTRDFAYLTIKRNGSPMHFTEVAKGIEKLFGRKTHPATTHNELIKDGRFVLVGRGLYALKEWGYSSGVVRDVVKSILEREGPLSREDILDRVKRERYVKDATISVNLQGGMFTKLPDGRYSVTKSKK